jgi:hypothetical protein
MTFENIDRIDAIKEGDRLIIEGRGEIFFAKTQIVKVSKDGTEIIYNKKKNEYFNLGMYLEGTSWVKDVRIIRLS